MAEVEVTQAAGLRTTTYEWLSSLPLATSASAAVYNMYEGSKNYNCVTQYAVGRMESSVKMAASVVAPVVKKLDKPIQAVDSFTASKLIQLGENVPAVKSQPEDVVTYISEAKEAFANKIIEGRTAISTRFTQSKDNLSNQFTCGKELVCSKINAGTEAIVKSRAGVAVGEGKQMITYRLAQGKEAVGNTVASGRDTVYTKIQSSTEYLASTRAGMLMGSGVDCSLTATENWMDYLLPEIENEKELFACEMKEDVPVVGLPRTRRFSDNSPAQEEEEPAVTDVPAASRVNRMSTLTRKVKLRMYFHAMQRLQSMQQNCQATLVHLKQTVDLLKLAQTTRDGMDKQYQSVASALKDLEEQIKQLLSRQSGVEHVSWLPKDDDDDCEVKVDWITPNSQGIVQASLDRAKQLSETVYHTFKSVTVATTYLPSHLRKGTIQGYQYAQEVYSTLKQVQSPVDLTTTTLNSMSSLLETQHGYISQLGMYLSSVMKKSAVASPSVNETGANADDPSGSELESGEEPIAE